MNRIIALNEDTNSHSSCDDNLTVTKEAQETIAISEYYRALHLKKENKIDDALILFRELLNVQILCEITSEHKDDKLFSVKYNCYKNLGLIYLEKKDTDLALKYLLNALELDDTDVYTMNKLGQLALDQSKPELAQYAYEKCLKRSPNYWPAGDGILQVLCMKECYNEAYGWALVWYKKDKNYKRGLDVILEIRERFGGMGMEYFENSWPIKFLDLHLKRTNAQSVFPKYSVVEPEPIKKPEIGDLKIDELTWMSIGTKIIKFYDKYDQDTNALCYHFTFNEFFMDFNADQTQNEKEESMNVDSPDGVNIIGSKPELNSDVPSKDPQNSSKSNNGDNSNSDEENRFVAPSGNGIGDGKNTGNEIGAEDSDAKTSDVSLTDAKPKSGRRRGSDLSFLEQWGWHKNRRYAQRKKSCEVDTTVNGIIRRILPKYFQETFENDVLFNVDDCQENANRASKINEESYNNVSVENFQKESQIIFEAFLQELKDKHFDQLTLIFKWLSYVSRFWDTKIPTKIQELYLKIFLLHLNHCDLATWNLLPEDEFVASFRLTILYLEIFHDRAVQKTKFGIKNEVDPQWLKLFNHITFYSTFHGVACEINEEYSKYRKRLHWLQFCLALYEYDLSRAVSFLEWIVRIMKDDGNIAPSVDLPNQINNNRIDLPIIENIINSLNRTISINSVHNLYNDKKFDKLVDIMIDSLTNSHMIISHLNVPIRLTTQFELLLESLWNLELFDDCFIWAEKCLKYSLDKFCEVPQHKQMEWAESINFILLYIEAIMINESPFVVSILDKYYARLVQSVTRIVSNQVDTPFDKNNNRPHAINTKIPWVLLHFILQREEDLNMMPSRQLSASSDRDELEDVIPCSLMIFFTAHEFLGLRSWCTRHDGQLLLHTLDVVVTKLRAPYLEPFREILAEYLEQVTYCLYGYPAKRARAKHIEEHDATNIELTWERSMQLFDLYRPDQLPEFNSYKNDSVSADMEQLLQRIVNLMPKDNDPNAHIQNIKNFINGTSSILPLAVNCLPHKMYCLFYLLADYYFKNRDFAKSTKYYILDLTTCPTRFDSWAGLALSKTSKLETKLNSCGDLCTNEFLTQSKDALRCFKQCFELDKTQVPLWIEYGNLAYVIHSFCSRSLKQSSATLSMERFAFMEEKKDECLKIALDCFTTVEQSTKRPDESESHDEKWLYHYMLGKIAEKQKEHPEIFLEHYLKASKCLYEHNASYPFRISHSNPQNLSVEALEVFYRITSSVIKYIEQHSTITRSVGKFFLKTLKEVSASPFAMNQAKIDDNSINALKRKLSLEKEEAAKKRPKNQRSDNEGNMEVDEPVENPIVDESIGQNIPEVKIPDDVASEKNPMENPASTSEIPASSQMLTVDVNEGKATLEPAKETEKIISPNRRGSQESSVTTGTTTTTGSDSTSSSSSDSSSSDSSTSESDSDSSEECEKNKNAPLSDNDLESIYKSCIRNLEECVTRFPEHYKSIYRLINIYLHAPESVRDLKKCKQLLLGTYTTSLNNQIQGLFFDRKNNNFFNGIWRIPSTEIDRPGSFSAHLSKCVIMLIEVLRLSLDHKILLEFALQIQRNPDNDKRYIKDSERKELFHQAISFCMQSFKNLLKKHGTDCRDEKELQSLMIEIYKAHKKCVKYIVQKESHFSTLLVDSYKVYIEGKPTKIPDNVNALDFVIRICQHEIAARKFQEKNAGNMATSSIDAIGGFTKVTATIPVTTVAAAPIVPTLPPSAMTTTQPPPSSSSSILVPHVSVSMSSGTSTITTTASGLTTTVATVSATSATSSYVSGLSRPRGRPPGSKNSNQSQVSSSKLNTAQIPKMDPALMSAMMGIYSNPALIPPMAYSDPAAVSALLAEFYKLTNLTGVSMLGKMGNTFGVPQKDTKQPPVGNSSTNPSGARESKSTNLSTKLPASTVISVGSGQLTITPTISTTKASYSKDPNPSSSQSLLSKDKFQKSNLQTSGFASISSVRQEKPSVSVTKVPSQSTSPGFPTSLPDFPKSLPKSLTITPTPAGYTGKPPTANQTPSITLQPEKQQIEKPKKKSQSFKQSAQMPMQNPFGSFNIQDYSQHFAMFNKYAEMMKGINPAAGVNPMNILSQFGSIPSAQTKKSTKTQSTKGKQTKSQSARSGASVPSTSKESISIKPIQPSQHPSSISQPKSRNPSASMQKPYSVTSMPKQSPGSTITSSYSMVDLTKPMSSPFSIPSSSPSPNKSPIGFIPSVTPPAAHQISPTKTLQQKLAERQKALMDANARSGSSGN